VELFYQLINRFNELNKIDLENIFIDSTKIEYDAHIKICGNRNSCSKTDRDAMFMRMKEEKMGS